MSAEDKIRNSLAWRGPSGKPMGHVVVTREQAEELLREIDRYRCNDAQQMQRAIFAEKMVARMRVLLNDKAYIQRKADYNKGHLSWHNMLREQEGDLNL
jgi:hypothetical protein